MSGFTYKKNCFFFENLGDRFSDSDSLLKLLNLDSSSLKLFSSDYSFASETEYEEAIALDHELNHLIQDLSITSCITVGFFHDYISALARDLSNIDDIHFPLASPENRKHNQHLNSSANIQIEHFYQLLDTYEYLFEEKHYKPHSQKCSDSESVFEQYSLRFLDLLEAYAYHKAYIDFFVFNQSGSKADLLHNVIVKNNIYPLKWYSNNGVCGYSVDFKHHIKFHHRYQMVMCMIMMTIPFGKSYSDYCENDIPNNYFQSPAIEKHSMVKVILETALHIPSLSFIMSKLEKGDYSKDAFSPVHRFYSILKSLYDNNGFPEAVPNEDFFVTFYNWAAKKNSWPSYQDTFDSIEAMLWNRAIKNKEAISSYQLIAVQTKRSSFGKFSQAIPAMLMQHLHLPLVFTSKEQLFAKILINNFHAVVPTTSFHSIMFHEKVHYYSPYHPSMNENEVLQTGVQNAMAAIREILCRLFSGAAMNTYLYNGLFRCPFAKNGGCPYSSSLCDGFTCFKTILDNCRIKVFRPEYGMAGDCMYFNYLLDYQYNINKIQNNE